jgi:threonine/homoserine efflux transporter RhtA
MALYTFFVFGPLALALWSSRRQRNFWIGASLLIAAHAVVLYIIRSIFPFRSVLIVIPIALVEACALYLIMLKMIGTGEDSTDVPD